MDTLARIFKILSDKNRLRIIALLSKRKMCVCELAFTLGVTQPSVSRHLKRMKKAKIIQDEQDRFWTNYFLSCDNPKTKRVLALVKQWLNEDKTIGNDLKKLKKADRTKLCCK